MLKMQERIRRARRRAELSQAELARRIKVQRSAVSNWESASEILPSMQNLIGIAKVCKVSLEWLGTGRGGMSKDPEVLKSYHDAGADKVKAVLDQGKDVVFLTLGDPTVYSTYLYIHHRLVAQGYETEIVCGITSFCAVSARLNTGLVEKAEPLHVIPASYQIEDALKLSGTKVLMKAGKKMKDVKAELLSQGAEAMMIENCGMPDEKIYRTVEEIPEDAGYYSLIIIKENKDGREE